MDVLNSNPIPRSSRAAYSPRPSAQPYLPPPAPYRHPANDLEWDNYPVSEHAFAQHSNEPRRAEDNREWQSWEQRQQWGIEDRRPAPTYSHPPDYSNDGWAIGAGRRVSGIIDLRRPTADPNDFFRPMDQRPSPSTALVWHYCGVYWANTVMQVINSSRDY